MSKQTTKQLPAVTEAGNNAPAVQNNHLKGELKHVGGSQADVWNRSMFDQALRTASPKSGDPAEREKLAETNIVGLIGIAPRDELEGMIAVQLVAAHNAAMECYRRALIPEQNPQMRFEYLNQASKLSRTYTTVLEALNRYRGKGQQKVTVEHVTVNAGGQAIVGMVQAPGGGEPSEIIEEQPRALTPEPSTPMRSPHKKRKQLPRARNA
jgi:hypothetical protein